MPEDGGLDKAPLALWSSCSSASLACHRWPASGHGKAKWVKQALAMVLSRGVLMLMAIRCICSFMVTAQAKSPSLWHLEILRWLSRDLKGGTPVITFLNFVLACGHPLPCVHHFSLSCIVLSLLPPKSAQARVGIGIISEKNEQGWAGLGPLKTYKLT